MKIVSKLPRFDLADNIKRNMNGWKCERPTVFENKWFTPALVEFLCGGTASIAGW